MIPHAGGEAEDGLSDGGGEVDHHGFWQIKLIQLPQEEPPLLSRPGDGAEVQLPLECLGHGGAQEAVTRESHGAAIYT